MYFELAFFVVLISLVLQGWTIAPVARWLRIELPPSTRDPEHLALKIPNEHEKVLLVYQALVGSNAVGMNARHLPLSEGAQLVGIIRRGVMIVEWLEQSLMPGDQVVILTSAGSTQTLNRTFATRAPASRLEPSAFFGEFVIHPDARLADLAQLYGFELPPALQQLTLSDYFDKTFYG